MRVLQVVESAATGVGKHVVDLSEGLARRGDDVTVLYSDGRMDDAFRAGLVRLREAGVRCEVLEMHRELSRRDLQARVLLKNHLRTNPPYDVAHGHASKAGAILRTAGHGRLPTVYTPHAFITMSRGLPERRLALYRFIEKQLSRKRGLIVCVSENERRHAVEFLRINPLRLRVVYNAVAGPVPGDRAALREGLGIAPEAFVAGFVGRMSDQKNPRFAIEAFRRAREGRPHLRLVMVGDGEHLEALRAERPEGVIFTGHANGPLLMNVFDAFVLSSQYEGFPYVLLEAAAAGVPTVSTDMGAADECVVEGKTGFLVPVEDAEAMAARLARLADDEALRAEMAEAARRRAADFSLDAMVDGVRTVYRELAGSMSRH